MEWINRQFELSREINNSNVRPMEGLRGFAVFLVFLVHFESLVQPWISQKAQLFFLLTYLHGLGNAGVDLFFVLSGYLIYGSLISKKQSFLKFMSRRVKRIYPVFTLVFIVYVILSFVFPVERKIPEFPLEGLIYLVANFLLLPGIFSLEPMITVAWSLSYEMFYYLTIPLVILVFQLRERSICWRLSFFVFLALTITIFFGIYGGPIRLVMFISGVLLYEAVKGNFVFNHGSKIGFVALILGLLCMLSPLPGMGGFAIKIFILSIAFFILCLACFKNPSEWLPRGFSWTPLRWLGNMSYSYYLLHGLTLKTTFLCLATILPPVANYGTWFFWVLLLPVFALTLVPAAFLFLWVERPFSLGPPKEKASTRAISIEMPFAEIKQKL